MAEYEANSRQLTMERNPNNPQNLSLGRTPPKPEPCHTQAICDTVEDMKQRGRCLTGWERASWGIGFSGLRFTGLAFRGLGRRFQGLGSRAQGVKPFFSVFGWFFFSSTVVYGLFKQNNVSRTCFCSTPCLCFGCLVRPGS